MGVGGMWEEAGGWLIGESVGRCAVPFCFERGFVALHVAGLERGALFALDVSLRHTPEWLVRR